MTRRSSAFSAKPIGLAVMGIALFFVLGGPAPGSVGDCSADSNIANAAVHCREAGAWRCARRRARGDITMEEEAQCAADLRTNCPGTNWPPMCAPTAQASQACIAALQVNPGASGVCAPDNCAATEPCMQCDNPPACANLCASSTGALSSDPSDPDDPTDAGPMESDAEVMP